MLERQIEGLKIDLELCKSDDSLAGTDMSALQAMFEEEKKRFEETQALLDKEKAEHHGGGDDELGLKKDDEAGTKPIVNTEVDETRIRDQLKKNIAAGKEDDNGEDYYKDADNKANNGKKGSTSTTKDGGYKLTYKSTTKGEDYYETTKYYYKNSKSPLDDILKKDNKDSSAPSININSETKGEDGVIIHEISYYSFLCSQFDQSCDACNYVSK